VYEVHKEDSVASVGPEFGIFKRTKHQEQPAAFEYRCDSGHLRTPYSVTQSGHCRECAVRKHRPSKWVRVPVTPQPAETTTEQLANFYLEDHDRRVREKEERERAAAQARVDKERREQQAADLKKRRALHDWKENVIADILARHGLTSVECGKVNERLARAGDLYDTTRAELFALDVIAGRKS
jgi:hypothetical protein